MHRKKYIPILHFLIPSGLLLCALFSNAQAKTSTTSDSVPFIFLLIFLLIILLVAIIMFVTTKEMIFKNRKRKLIDKEKKFTEYLNNLDSDEIETFLKQKKVLGSNRKIDTSKLRNSLFLIGALCSSLVLNAQTGAEKTNSVLSGTGIIITIILILIPIFAGIVLMLIKFRSVVKKIRNNQNLEEADKLADYVSGLSDEKILAAMEKRKAALDYRLSNSELSGAIPAADEKGIINHAGTASGLTFVAIKKKAVKRPNIDPQLSKLILWYIGCATFWLLFGTTVGEYLGIKFVAPDADQISWLSFGRLRPVHTNAVFWGWAGRCRASRRPALVFPHPRRRS